VSGVLRSAGDQRRCSCSDRRAGRTGVRASIVGVKSRNGEGAKGGRKVET
jgi:hypothetical protein